MKKFLGNKWTIAVFLCFVFGAIAFWGFTSSIPSENPGWLISHHIEIAIGGILAIVGVCLLTVKIPGN